MLQANREQTTQLPREALAIAIQGGDLHPAGPADGFVETGNREAALVVFSQVRVQNGDLWIDENQGVIAFLGDIYDQQALVYIDLRSGKADAGRLLHCLQHIGD